MWWRLAVLLAFALGSLVFVAREILLVGQGKRHGLNEIRLYRRFRRRTKGVLILGFLLIQALFFEMAMTSLHFRGRELILYLGMTMITLIWLLITAGRDLKEAAQDAVLESRALRQQAIEEMEEKLREIREKPGENR